MGKGDIKSRKGKLANGSFGKTRKRNETLAKTLVVAKAAPAKEKEKVEAEAKPAKAKSKKAEK